MISRTLPAPLRRAAARTGFLSRLVRLLAVRRERSRLSQLDEHSLRDVGISPHEAQTEAARPFWDAPDSWRR